MTAAEAIRLGTRILHSRQLRDPRLDSELLLATVLGKTRTFLLAYPETVLTDLQQTQFIDWLEKRSQHYPIQYLTGKQEFYGHEFRVTPDVLIPRPETEILVETSLDLLRGCSDSPPTVLDIGTGSGCIAISIGLADARVRLTATDISAEALKVARDNARRLGCDGQITFYQADLFPPPSETGLLQACDLVVSNPPYINPSDKGTVDVSVQLFEPPAALYAADDGMAVYERIFEKSGFLLRKNGHLVLEMGQEHARIVQLSRTYSWHLRNLCKDLAGLPRCAVFAPPGQ